MKKWPRIKQSRHFQSSESSESVCEAKSPTASPEIVRNRNRSHHTNSEAHGENPSTCGSLGGATPWTDIPFNRDRKTSFLHLLGKQAVTRCRCRPLAKGLLSFQNFYVTRSPNGEITKCLVLLCMERDAKHIRILDHPHRKSLCLSSSKSGRN